MRCHRFHPGARRAFTVVEVLVTAVIAVGMTAAATVALGQFFRLRTTATSSQQAWAEASTALGRLARDAQSVVRSREAVQQRVRVVQGGSPGQERDELLVLMRSLQPVGADPTEAEGGEYEAHYKILPASDGDALWRRIDPAFDATQDGGGVATVIARHSRAFIVEAFDGSAWTRTWDSDQTGLPHALRVTIRTASADGSSEAVLRRTIAMDRAPVTPEDVQDAQAAEADESGDSQGSAPSGGGNSSSGGGGGP